MADMATPSPPVVAGTAMAGAQAAAVAIAEATVAQLPDRLMDILRTVVVSGTVAGETPEGLTRVRTGAGDVLLKTDTPLAADKAVTLQISPAQVSPGGAAPGGAAASPRAIVFGSPSATPATTSPALPPPVPGPQPDVVIKLLSAAVTAAGQPLPSIPPGTLVPALVLAGATSRNAAPPPAAGPAGESRAAGPAAPRTRGGETITGGGGAATARPAAGGAVASPGSSTFGTAVELGGDAAHRGGELQSAPEPPPFSQGSTVALRIIDLRAPGERPAPSGQGQKQEQGQGQEQEQAPAHQGQPKAQERAGGQETDRGREPATAPPQGPVRPQGQTSEKGQTSGKGQASEPGQVPEDGPAPGDGQSPPARGGAAPAPAGTTTPPPARPGTERPANPAQTPAQTAAPDRGATSPATPPATPQSSRTPQPSASSPSTPPTPPPPRQAGDISEPAGPPPAATPHHGGQTTPRTAAQPGAGGPAPGASPSPSSSASPSSPPAAQRQETVLTGTIAGTTPQGQPILATRQGMLVLTTLPPLPAGTVVTAAITEQPRATALPPDPQLLTPGGPELPALRQVMAALSGLDRTLAQAILNTIMPQPNRKLASALTFFLSAVRGGDARGWLGGEATAALGGSGRDSLLRQLDEEFHALQQEAATPLPGDWRPFTLPMVDGTMLAPIHLYIHPVGGDDEDGNADSGRSGRKAKASRFLVDVDMTRLGALQLDGMVRERRFDLILRSNAPLPPKLCQELTEVFANCSSATGYAGALVFQPGGRGWVKPGPRGRAPSLRGVTA